jgi:hypothetical protein
LTPTGSTTSPAAGVDVSLYEAPKDRAEDLIGTLPHAIVVTRSKTVVRVVGVAPPGETLPEEYETLPLPAQSTSEMERRVTETRSRTEELEKELAALTGQRPVLLAATRQLAVAFEYVGVMATMDTEKELAWVTGFIPADRVDTVRQGGRDSRMGYPDSRSRSGRASPDADPQSQADRDHQAGLRPPRHRSRVS